MLPQLEKKAETFFFYFSEIKSTTFKLLKKYTVFIHNQDFSNKFIETTLVKQPFDELGTLKVPLNVHLHDVSSVGAKCSMMICR